MTTTFDIKTIQVMIYTNDRQNRIIEMKGSIFGFENVYAFFSDSALYSPDALNELTGYDPVEKRRIFFDPDLFYSFLELSHSKNPTPDPTINIRGCNFKTMIDSLFVVSFPVPKNVELDYNNYNCIGITADFMVSSVREFFQKNVYTYISSKNKKYTVLRTKWPNKITSNPDYSTSLVQALQIYNTGKTKFVDLKKAGIDVIIKNLVDKIGITPTVTTDVNGHVFKSYVIAGGNGKINDLIQNLNTKLKELQKEFYYYTYLWILYLSTEYDLPPDYFYSTTSGATAVISPGNFFTSTLYNLISFHRWAVKTASSSKPVPAATTSTTSAIFTPKKPTAAIASDAALKRLFSSYIIKGDKQCNIPSSIRANIIDDLEKIYTMTKRITGSEINISESQHLGYLTFGLEGDKSKRGTNQDDFKDFVKKFMKETNIVGSSEFDMKIQSGINNGVDSVSQKTFFDALLNLRNKDMFNAGLCEYGFDTKNGLYYKIRDLIDTIDFLGTGFKTTVDKLSATSIEDLELIENEFKTRIVRANEILEKKSQFKGQEIEKLFENIITERRQIQLTDTVETSRFQNTKKYRDPVWEKLYKESWYKNFANGLLEITQLRRSSNNDINTALGETGQYDINKLQELVNSLAEAGIDEINIGGNRSENLPTFKANLICVVAGGEITDENRRAIQCPYSSQKMGSLLSRLVLKLPANEDLRRTDFVDLTSAIKKAEQDAAAKNKTRKKENPKDDNRLAKEYGVEKYDDETIKQFLGKGGEQGFIGNWFGQGQVNPPGPAQSSMPISGDVRQFIDEKIKNITDYDSTGLKTSSFSQRHIIDSQDELIKFLVSKEPKTIPVLNEAIKISKEVSPDENKKTKIIEDINERISKYETTIKNSSRKMGLKINLDDETKKQQNYLELYNATIMKQLFEEILKELEAISTSPLVRQGSLGPANGIGSPRGILAKGGSHKRRIAIKKNRTQRKKQNR